MAPPFIQKLGGLFSDPRITGGVMGEGGGPDPYDPRLAAASELLAGSGYAPYKRSFGELFGQALMAAQKARALGVSQQQQEEQRKAQLALLQAQAANAQREIVPAGATVFENGQPKYTAPQKEIGASGEAGSLQEIDRINAYNKAHGMPEIDPNEYLAQRRGASADSQLYSQYATAALARGEIPLPMDQFLIKFRGAVAGSQKTGESTATAAFDLPRIEQNAAVALEDMKKLRDHPGLGKITGIYSLAPIVPGTEQAGAAALAKQVEGRTFLEAYNTLKGGGQITEVEGKKAEAAIGRLDRAQSKEDYQAALDDLSSIIQNGLDRARQQAGKSAPEGDAKKPKRVKVDAEGNVIGD